MGRVSGPPWYVSILPCSVVVLALLTGCATRGLSPRSSPPVSRTEPLVLPPRSVSPSEAAPPPPSTAPPAPVIPAPPATDPARTTRPAATRHAGRRPEPPTRPCAGDSDHRRLAPRQDAAGRRDHHPDRAHPVRFGRRSRWVTSAIALEGRTAHRAARRAPPRDRRFGLECRPLARDRRRR